MKADESETEHHSHSIFLYPSKEQERNGPLGPTSDTEIGKSEVANSRNYVGWADFANE